jgi:muramoyltetrapeptide carboxypeptidase
MKIDFLKKNDLVCVISPGSRAKEENVQKALSVLQSWGLRTELLDGQFGDHPYLANSDEVRWEHLKSSLLRSDCKAIWCTRGGYGANRLLPHLKKLKVPKKFKWVIGYSDVTSLHLFLNQKWKWPSLHAPLLETLADDKLQSQDLLALKNMLFGTFTHFKIPLQGLNEASKLKKDKTALLTGGNLTVVQSACGTFYQLKAKNKILFFEDIGERGYRIDRALVQLAHSGCLDQCAAILFGDFSLGNEPNGSNYVEQALREFAASTKIPCFSHLPVGHGSRNFPMPVGTKVTLRPLKGSTHEILLLIEKP